VAVGRVKRGPLQELCRDFSRRLTWSLDIREVEPKKRVDGPELAAHEADLIAAKLPPDAVLVTLDERGRNLSSPDFAARIGGWRESGRGDIAFVIGGAAGLHPSLRDRSDLVLSFGALTWPHQLARVMLIEQIYRAETILAGHPYHKV